MTDPNATTVSTKAAAIAGDNVHTTSGKESRTSQLIDGIGSAPFVLLVYLGSLFVSTEHY